MTPETPPRRRLLPPKALLISLLLQAPLLAAAWPLRPGPFWLAAGALALALGCAINLWADQAFRRSKVPVCPFKPIPRLVEVGPYRFTRNPMYLGMVLISAAPGLLAGLPFGVLPALALAVWLHVRFVLPEEPYLRQQLGQAYGEYCERVPRWILPGL